MGHVTTSAIPRPPFVRSVGAALTLLALLMAMVVTAAPADAHARLESSSPKDGATLTAVPPEIMLRFNEPIKDGLNQVTVTSGSDDVATGKVQVEGSSVYQPVDFQMDPGEYTVSYKVVSADGHPVSGSFSFSYDPPEGDTGAADDPSATTSSAPTGSTSSAPSSSSTSGSATSEPMTPSEPAEPSDRSTNASETSEPSSTSPDSSTSGPPDGETGPPEDSDRTSDTASPTTDEPAEDEPVATSPTSPWWWAVAVVALVVVIGGFALLVRGRRESEEEDVTVEEWRP